MCRKARGGVLLCAVVLALPAAGICTAVAAEVGTHPAGGLVAGCEHFAFQRAKVAEGLGGPAREACKSWRVSTCVDKEGTAYALDAENCQVYRAKNGTLRGLDAATGQPRWEAQGVGSPSGNSSICKLRTLKFDCKTVKVTETTEKRRRDRK